MLEISKEASKENIDDLDKKIQKAEKLADNLSQLESNLLGAIAQLNDRINTLNQNLNLKEQEISDEIKTKKEIADKIYLLCITPQKQSILGFSVSPTVTGLSFFMENIKYFTIPELWRLFQKVEKILFKEDIDLSKITKEVIIKAKEQLNKKKIEVKVRNSSKHISYGTTFEVEVKANDLVSSLKQIIYKRMESLGMELPGSYEKLCLFHKSGELFLPNFKAVSQIEGYIVVEFGSEAKMEITSSDPSLGIVPMVTVPSVQEFVANVEFHKLNPKQQEDILLLTAYLSEYKEGKTIQSCTGSIDETTTAILVISHFMKEFDIRTGVLPKNTQDSYIQQRFKGGIEFARKSARLNLGSIAALSIETEDPNDNPTLAPKFHFSLDMDYNKTIEKYGGIGKFADAFVNDIASSLKVPKASIIVQQVRRGSVKVDFILLKSYIEKVEIGEMRAEDVIKKVKDVNSNLYTGEITKFLNREKSIDLQFVPIFNEFDFSEDDFVPQYNMDYTKNKPLQKAKEKRGNHDYFPPFGYYRHALNIKKMNYDSDDKWIGMKNGPGEWCVAYHGTTKVGVDGIMKRLKAQKNWDSKFMTNDVRYSSVKSKNPRDGSQPIRIRGEGLYCTPNIEIAGSYSKSRGGFKLDLPEQRSCKYNLVFMCRVNPEQFDSIEVCDKVECGKQGYYWRVFPKNNKKIWDLRPYGILLKKLE